jgi:hypothetical protein
MVQRALREQDTVRVREAAPKLCEMMVAFAPFAGGWRRNSKTTRPSPREGTFDGAQQLGQTRFPVVMTAGRKKGSGTLLIPFKREHATFS